MFSFLSYFIVPTAVFLAAVKLNNKRRWLTARVGEDWFFDDYYTKGGAKIPKPMFWLIVFATFLLWWIVIPIMLAVFLFSLVIKWLTNGEGVVPKESSRRNSNRY